MMKALNFRQEDLSQLIRWGHWFVFFNILLSLLIGSAYPILSDWPSTFLGRFYAIVNTIGQFAFLSFLLYLITAFPLTFLLRSYRRLRWIMAIIATLGFTVLCSDILLYSQFKLHLNRYIARLLFSTENENLLLSGYVIIAVAVVIFAIEFALATYSWRRLSSLHKRKRMIAFPLITVCISAFLFSHLVHIWADANFYRPITMQRKNLPLSYPLTARHLLGKYGLLDEDNYQQRLLEQGNPFSMSIEYPLQNIQYQPQQPNQYNILLISLDGVNPALLDKNMPYLAQFAQNNLNYSQHFSSGITAEMGAFSLFYGLAPNFYDAVIVGRKNAVLINALIKRDYQLGFFSTQGFDSPLYRQALLSDFSFPPTHVPNKTELVAKWQSWLDKRRTDQRWFSYLAFDLDKDPDDYQPHAAQLDALIQQMIEKLETENKLSETVIIITANHTFNSEMQDEYSARQLKSPLIVHWPTKKAQHIRRATGHADIARTLIQDVLGVETTPQYYTQGASLFSEASQTSTWIFAGDNKNLVVMTDKNIIRIDQRGRYTVYDYQYQIQKEETLSISVLFKILKESRRFIVH